MTFFDELSKRVSGVAQSAQKTAEIARLQRQVNLKKEEMEGLFANIGRLYYNCYKRSVEPDETIFSLCDRADLVAAEIEGLNLKLDDLKQLRRCPSCGSVQNNTSRFCANCGARLEAYQEDPEPQPEEQAGEEEGRSVYIDWPEAGETAAPAEEENLAEENRAEEDLAEENAPAEEE